MGAERDLAVSLAKAAGVIMKKYFALGYGVDRRYKEDYSPVTAADLEIDELVCQSLRKRYPDYGIFSEEGGEQSGFSDYLWVCDPVDGTIPYAHGIPVATFSLALVYRGQPILGVICDPFLDRMFVAEKGQGAWLNGRRLTVSSVPELAGSSMGFECRITDQHFNFLKLGEELNLHKVRVLTMCSMLYSGSLVSRGEFLASIYGGDKPYDVAALKVIIEEAGGRVTDLAGQDQRYDQLVNGLVASNGYVHDWIVKLLHRDG